jgi:FAD binding domain-containing protein
VHNGLVERKPALIVRARSAQDVVAALAFARSGGFKVSVRGGGHNVADRAVTDGGVMIDLAQTRNITIDPELGTTTAQGAWLGMSSTKPPPSRPRGHRRRRVDDRHRGLHPRRRPGLLGKYGLTCDDLEAVELVTAAGDVL